MAEQQRNNTQAHIGGVASVIWAGSILLSPAMGLVREQIIDHILGGALPSLSVKRGPSAGRTATAFVQMALGG